MCLYCNNRGLVTVEKKMTIAGVRVICDYGVTCECKDNIPKDDMKYPKEFKLNQKETDIYLKITKERIAPWDLIAA